MNLTDVTKNDRWFSAGNKKEKYHFSGPDYARVAAIIWICLYHFLSRRYGWTLGSLYYGGKLIPFFLKQEIPLTIKTFSILSGAGILGNYIFFTISGLGLAMSQYHKSLPPLLFYRRRLLRILPAYWAALFLVFLVNIFMGVNINWTDYVLHFFCLHVFFPRLVFSISAPFWFIGVLLQLYLLFPFLFWLCRRFSPFLLIVFALFLPYYIQTFLVSLFGTGKFFTAHTLAFCSGIAIAGLFVRYNYILKKRHWLFSFIAVIPAVFLFYVVLHRPFAGVPRLLLFNLDQLAGIAICFVLLFINIRPLNKIVKKLAAVSFPVFLTHCFFLTVFFSHIRGLPLLLSATLFLFLSFAIGYVFNTGLKSLALWFRKIFNYQNKPLVPVNF